MTAAHGAPAFIAGGLVLVALGAWLVKKSRLPEGTAGFVSVVSARGFMNSAGWLLVAAGLFLGAIIGPGLWFAYH